METKEGTKPKKRKLDQNLNLKKAHYVLAEPHELLPMPKELQNISNFENRETFEVYDPLQSFNTQIPMSKAKIELVTETQSIPDECFDLEDTTMMIEENQLVGENLKMYPIIHQDKYILLLPHPCSLGFYGKLKLTIIGGQIEILGHKLSKDSAIKTINVFSSLGKSALSLETNFSIWTREDTELLKQALKENVLSKEHSKDILKIIKEDQFSYSVLLVEKATWLAEPVIKKFCTLKVFPSKTPVRSYFGSVGQKLNCHFFMNYEDDLKIVKKSPDWDCVSTNGKMIICGGKSVGKSTTLKYLINKALMEHGEVICFDLDPGQSEFTPPGFLSYTIIQQPLLGNNFTHDLIPERMVFLGEINVANCPQKYLECIDYLFDKLSQDERLNKLPCFVNTMGFCKGLGYSLMINVLCKLCPDTVVQIQSTDPSLNYPIVLKSKNLCAKKYLAYNARVINSINNYEHILLNSTVESCNGNSYKSVFQPAQNREIILLAYFSKFMSPPTYTLNTSRPYSIQFSKLLLQLKSPIAPAHILQAFNGSMVALSHFEKDDGVVKIPDQPDFFSIVNHSRVIPSFGLGFVRGIDCNKKELFLLTHLPQEILELVNCLTLSNYAPPKGLMLQQRFNDASVPYTSVGSNIACQRVKRSFKTFNPTSPHQKDE